MKLRKNSLSSSRNSRPKIVPLTSTNICVSAANIAATLSLTPEDRCLNIMPLFHIHGLIAAVPEGNWSALDERERAYFRSPIEREALTCNLDQPPVVQIYQANPDHVDPEDSRKPILLSYLDVVIQGYLRVFGQEGVESFFATTLGWETPIRDDRAAPVYSRAQSLSRAETVLVDRHLTEVSALVEPAQVTVSTG